MRKYFFTKVDNSLIVSILEKVSLVAAHRRHQACQLLLIAIPLLRQSPIFLCEAVAADIQLVLFGWKNGNKFGHTNYTQCTLISISNWKIMFCCTLYVNKNNCEQLNNISNVNCQTARMKPNLFAM